MTTEPQPGLLAHVHIMKTGGQTICDILRQSFPGGHCDVHGSFVMASQLRLAMRCYPRLSSIAGHGVHPNSDLKKACPTLRFFTFLRDPVSRCVSHYQFDRQKNASQLDFETWLQRHANFQTRFLTRDEDGPHLSKTRAELAIHVLQHHVDFVGLQEQFDESLVMLRRWSGAAALGIGCRPRNIARDNRIKKQLLADPAIVAQIRQHHQEDQRMYDFVKEVVYPQQMEKWGEGLAEEVARLRATRIRWPRSVVRRLLASSKRNLIYKPMARRQEEEEKWRSGEEERAA